MVWLVLRYPMSVLVRHRALPLQVAPQPHWLIDDEGQIFDSRSAELRTRLNAWHTGDGLLDYTVRNLGFIDVAWLGSPGRAALHIRLRPQHTPQVAIAGLLRWLAQYPARRVMLTWFDGRAWHSEVLGDGAMARTKLASLAKLPLDPAAETDLAETELAETDLAEPA
jgi:hypothetical protein